MDDTETRCGGVASAHGNKGCIGLDGGASEDGDGGGGNVNSGADRTRSEKKLNISAVDTCRRL